MVKQNIIFLTGHRKSGTTLLHRLFDGHKQIDVYPGDFTYFYAYFPFFTQKYKGNKKKLISRILLIFQKLQEFETYDRNYNRNKILKSCKNLKKNLHKVDVLSKKDIFKIIISEWYNLTQKKRKKFLLIKETSQSIFFDEFISYFPSLKMVNIIRDPRDNFSAISSGIDKYYSKFGEDHTSSLTSTLFRARQDLISAKINSNKKNYMNIKFEDLIQNPKKISRKITKFLQIENSKILLIPTIFEKPYLGNNFDESFNGINKTNVKNWKKRISNNETRIIEFFMHDAMKLWGYKISFKLIDSQIDYANFYEKVNSKYFFKDSFS